MSRTSVRTFCPTWRTRIVALALASAGPLLGGAALSTPAQAATTTITDTIQKERTRVHGKLIIKQTAKKPKPVEAFCTMYYRKAVWPVGSKTVTVGRAGNARKPVKLINGQPLQITIVGKKGTKYYFVCDITFQGADSQLTRKSLTF